MRETALGQWLSLRVLLSVSVKYAAHVAFLYTVLTPALSHAQDLLARWQFEDTTGRTCLDASSLKLHGTYLDGVLQRRGRQGLAVAFTHQDARQRVEVALNADAQESIGQVINRSFTFEIWLQDQAPQPDGRRNYAIFYKADRNRFMRNSL